MEKSTITFVLCILFALFVFSQDIPSPNPNNGDLGPFISGPNTSEPQPMTSDVEPTSDMPSGPPTSSPTGQPSSTSMDTPSGSPTSSDNPEPSPNSPTEPNTPQPMPSDVKPPSDMPSGPPPSSPTGQPSSSPTGQSPTTPAKSPSDIPNEPPTVIPSVPNMPQPMPSVVKPPSDMPSGPPPTGQPTTTTMPPAKSPSDMPSGPPTVIPSEPNMPQPMPSVVKPPSDMPSGPPTSSPTGQPSSSPTGQSPTTTPATKPPSDIPNGPPTAIPSEPNMPQPMPSVVKPPSDMPSGPPPSIPTGQPTTTPATKSPSDMPSGVPTSSPTGQPSTTTPATPNGPPSVIPSMPIPQPMNKPPSQNNIPPTDQKLPAPQTNNYPPTTDQKPNPFFGKPAPFPKPPGDMKPAPQTNVAPTVTTGPTGPTGVRDQPAIYPFPYWNTKPSPQNSGTPSGDKKPAPQTNVTPTGDKKPAPQTTVTPTGDRRPAPQTTVTPTGDRKPSPQSTPSGDKKPIPQPAPAVIIIKNCDGACSGERPCSNAFCRQDPFSLTCNWVTSLCVTVVPVNTTVNCSINGACGSNVPSCNSGKPICVQTGQTCTYICQSSGDNGGTQIDCTGRCSGGPLCSSSVAKCGLVSIQSASSLSVAAQCQWMCPDPCASWCSGFNCPSGYSQIACGVNNQGSSSCLPYCASSECSSSSNCLASSCPPGTYGICKGPRSNCSLTCISLSCDACNPNCVPICALGSSAPCVNSHCGLGSTDSSGSGSLLSKCAWIPNLSSKECISQQIKICSGKPPCAASTCVTDGNGNLNWDSSNCDKDCSSVPQALCPGGYINCTSGSGYCYLSGSNCIWTCPIDPCTNATSGEPTCPLPAPEGPPFAGCISWRRRCIARDSSATSTACAWKVDCFKVAETNGSCESVDCGTKPNTSCPGKERWSCNRPPNGGLCQWLFVCPADPTLTTACSESDCPVVNTVDDSSSGVCGINPEAKPVCVRNCKGICERLTPCVPVYSLPSCVLSPCGDVCYDPRWLTQEITPPDSFDSSSNFSTNCTLCERRCSTLLTCSRPSSNPICQLTSSERYSKCIAKCNYVPVVVTPVSTNDTTSPTAPTATPTTPTETPTTPTGPYRGQNPCLCDYSISVFVTAIYPQKNIMVASCVSKEMASNSGSLPGDPVVYSSTSKPSYCQVQDEPVAPGNDTTATPTSPTPSAPTSVIDAVSNLNPDDIQDGILDKLNNEDSKDFTDYLPAVSAVLVPSESTSENSTDHEKRVNIGVIITLSGATQPSDDTLGKWCFFVLGHVVETLKTKIEVCVFTLQSSQTQKRGTTAFVGSYSLTSDISSTTPPADNSPAPDMGTPVAPTTTPSTPATPSTPITPSTPTTPSTPATPSAPVMAPVPQSTPTTKIPSPAPKSQSPSPSPKPSGPTKGPATGSSSKLIWSFFVTVIVIVLVVF